MLGRGSSRCVAGVSESPVWGSGGSVRAAATLVFAVALRMRAAGRGVSKDEVEEVDEAEDEEEVVDAGWAVMRAALWAAASAAATAGRMEGMSSGCRLEAGGWGGPVVTWRPGGPIWSAAAGDGGAGLWPSPSGLGWAGVLQCVRLCWLASAGGNSSRGAVQLLSRTSATRSSKMPLRPTRAVLCFWSVIQIVPYCLDSDLLEACLILTSDVFFLEMVVNPSHSRAPSVLAPHSCSNAEFLHYLDD